MVRPPLRRLRAFARRLVPSLAVAVAAVSCSTSGDLITVEAALFMPRLSGDAGLATTVMTDVDTIDLKSELDLGERELVPYVRAELNAARIDAAVSGFRLSQSGQGTVTANFGNITAGSTVDSKLDLGFVHGRLAFDLFDSRWLTVGAGLGADYIDLDLEASEPVFGLSESVQVRQGLPLVVARAVVRPPALPFDFALEVSGITGHYQDIDGSLIDIEALLHWKVTGPLALFAGYRFIHFNIEGQASSRGFDGDITLSGFMLGASIRF